MSQKRQNLIAQLNVLPPDHQAVLGEIAWGSDAGHDPAILADLLQGKFIKTYEERISWKCPDTYTRYRMTRQVRLAWIITWIDTMLGEDTPGDHEGEL